MTTSHSNTTPPRVEGQDWCEEETLELEWLRTSTEDGNFENARVAFTVDGVPRWINDGWGSDITENSETVGRMVACTRALAGTPLPANVEPGAITRELEQLRAHVAELERDLSLARADVESAAADLSVPIPEPGSDMSRVMIANRLIWRNRADCYAVIHAAREYMEAEDRERDKRELLDWREESGHRKTENAEGYLADATKDREQKYDALVDALKVVDQAGEGTT